MFTSFKLVNLLAFSNHADKGEAGDDGRQGPQGIGENVAADELITFESLLHEMIDRDFLPRLPQPAYFGHPSSSYNRRSVSPDDPDG